MMTKKKKVTIAVSVVATVLVIAIIAIACAAHFVGFPKCVGEKKYSYTTKEIHVEHDGINLFGKALIPKGESGAKYPTVIYAHGAESDYKADMTTLQSLAKSGIACYTFDFYGWTTRSTGPKGTKWFKGTKRGVDDAYEKQVLEQVKDLNAVIEKVKTFDFVDTDNIFLLGSSMGGATVATCAVTHSDDIRAIILQYPAINLNPDANVDGATNDVNKYTKNVLLLQGTADKIVPLSMSETLCAHYNKYNANHCKMVVYEGQPHVFTGKYKVEAAKEIYAFLKNEMAK